MKLFLNNLNKICINIPMVNQTNPIRFTGRGSNSLEGPSRDVFVKSAPATDILFLGRRKGSTKKGDVLKELDDITCPYSGVKMLNSRKMDQLDYEFSQCKDMKDQLKLLDKNKKYMLPLEKSIYNTFKEYYAANPQGNMNDCLNNLKPECLEKLKISELQVIDNIDALSNKANAKTGLAVRRVTTDARKRILNDTNESIFKRKDILSDIFKATKGCHNKGLANELWDEANKLPKSTNDYNAFVVKYANRSPIEIATRLIRPSVASIEHISPANRNTAHASHGANDMTNFMLASVDWNSGRGNIALSEFVKNHPDIPKHSQEYTDDIISAIHKGKLVDNDWYPYVLKEKLYNESEGLIDVSLDKYKISKDEAFKNAPVNAVDAYQKLKSANVEIRAKAEE